VVAASSAAWKTAPLGIDIAAQPVERRRLSASLRGPDDVNVRILPLPTWVVADKMKIREAQAA
jgi:hypothetical protein